MRTMPTMPTTMAFVTVSDENRYICVWENSENLDAETIANYRSQGYTIIRLNNGTGNIRDCFRSIAKSSSIYR